MCGIAGRWTVGSGVTETGIVPALDRIRHRGPDDSNVEVDGPCTLGMCRLAIIDVDGGRQPIHNEDGSVSVVFNGEIYNYKELAADLRGRGHRFRTDSDTEVLVHLYEERGDRLVDELRGMFAFAIHDRWRGRLLLARDRFGKKPLYHARTRDGGLIFASELKALRALAEAAGEQWVVRDQAIYDFLSLAVVPQPETVYAGVSMLPPGSRLVFDGRACGIERYWSAEFRPTLAVSYGEAQEMVRSEVARAVELRLRSDVPLGVFLSGGVDSSVVAFEAARHVGERLRTFTVSVPDPTLDEAAVAARTAREFGVQNTMLRLEASPLEGLQRLVRQYDQPFADPSAIPTLEISRLAREHVKVVLNGDGGDEVFGGYRRYLAARWLDRLSWVPEWPLQVAAAWGGRAEGRRSVAGFIDRFARGLLADPATRYLAWTTDMLLEPEKSPVWRGGAVRPTELRVAEELPAGLGGVAAQAAADVRLNLLSDLLVKMDIATSAHSLEARSPLLDHRVAELAFRLPEAYKVRGRRGKAVLRDAYRGRLPREVLEGKKRGFEIPLARWLRDEFRPILMDTLAARNARVRGFLDDALVDELLNAPARPGKNWAYVTFAVLVLELWLREVAQPSVSAPLLDVGA